jgi:hypothetical protein
MGDVAAMYCPIGDGSSIEQMPKACRQGYFVQAGYLL